jgi:WD40 repeat protein
MPTQIHKVLLSLTLVSLGTLWFGMRITATGQQAASTPSLHLLHTMTGPKDAGDYANSIAFAPDGKQLAVGHNDGPLQLWDTETGKLVSTLVTDGGSIDAVAFSSDGKRLAVADNEEVTVWNVVTRKRVRSFEFDEANEIPCVAFSPDGKWLAAGSSTSEDDQEVDVKVWNTATWRPHLRWKAHEHSVNAVAFTPHGDLLAVGGGSGQITLFSTASWRVLRTITNSDCAKSLAFSANGRMLAIGDLDDHRITLWNTATWRHSKTLQMSARNDPDTMVYSLSFSPDGNLLLAAGDAGVELWNVPTGKRLHHFQGAFATTFSVDGKRLAIGDMGGTTKIWSITSR